MGKGSAPEPPDPIETGKAQTGTNIGTAVANNYMTLTDQITPTGSLTYDQTGTYAYTDPVSGVTYDIPRFTATTSLSPEQQAILDQSQAAQGNLASLANDRSAFLKDYLPTTEAATDQIDGKLYDLGSKRLDPRFAQEEDALRTRLAQQGIAPGSEAYNREMTLLGQSKNDAYNQLLLSGRGQAMAEVNAPINQITALLSGSQVSSPNVQMQSPQGAATTDYAGLFNNNYNQRLNIWQQKNAQQQSLLGGLFGLGSSAIMASDVRLKKDIRRVGTTDEGLPIYTYRYKSGGPVQMGVMAQDVIKVKPEAVHAIGDGFLGVDYAEVR